MLIRPYNNHSYDVKLRSHITKYCTKIYLQDNDFTMIYHHNIVLISDLADKSCMYLD